MGKSYFTKTEEEEKKKEREENPTTDFFCSMLQNWSGNFMKGVMFFD